MGQFPGHVFGLVPDDILAHEGENAVRMEHMSRFGDLGDGLVGDFDGAFGELAQHVGVRMNQAPTNNMTMSAR